MIEIVLEDEAWLRDLPDAQDLATACFKETSQVEPAVRGNIARLTEAGDWRAIVEGPIEPVIEDADFAKAAAALVPDGPLDAESWGAFTNAVKEATGAKGKKLFMPLRKALTGVEHGPEMGPLFALIGSAKARARFGGQRA